MNIIDIIMSYISEEGLQNLKKYKYVSGGYSRLDNLMNPFWERVVELYPIVFVIYNDSGWHLI